MSYSELRAQARENLRGRWALAIAVALVACLLGGLLVGMSFIPNRNEASSEDWRYNWAKIDLSGDLDVSVAPLGLVGFILGGAVQLGYAGILLKQQENRDYEFRDLFSQFHRFGQGFAQKFLRGLYCFLWGLLLIIPGIVKSYSYAMTPFIMADHPHLTASEAIDRSREMMDGHKGDLFLLHLSFIGWDLLAALTLNIGHLVLNPYKNAAQAAFYRELAGYPKISVE